jgi:hypothetical protein
MQTQDGPRLDCKRQVGLVAGMDEQMLVQLVVVLATVAEEAVQLEDCPWMIGGDSR